MAAINRITEPNSTAKLPYLKLYIGDLKKENSYRCLTIESRGVWMEMLFIMHDSNPRGYVFLQDQQLANTIGIPLRKLRICLKEMESVKTFSRDENGVIFNRRMVREGQVSEVRSAAGIKGGSVPKNRPGFVYLISNPSNGHTKIGISGEPEKRFKAILVKEKGCKLLATVEVSDMASQEAILHARYRRFNAAGEWFELPADDLAVLLRSFEANSLELCITKSPTNHQQKPDIDDDIESGSKKKVNDAETIRAWLHQFTDGKFGKASDAIVLKMLQLLGDSPIEVFQEFLISLHDRKLKPDKSYGWFITMAENYFGGFDNGCK